MSIDLNFRPTSYSDFDDPIRLALNGIKGQKRREMVRDMLSAEGEQREAYDAVLGSIEDGILEEDAPEGFDQSLNYAFGPSWLGGVYLPDLEQGEVEIARIVLDSTLQDVFCVRARYVGGVYHYRFVDDLEGRYRVEPETSKRPLTLGELVQLIDTVAWVSADPTVDDDNFYDQYPWIEGWWWAQRDSDEPLDRCTDFVRVESEQYPDLRAYYEERARLWRQAREREDEGGREGR